jgi:hypothetical protein
LIWRKVLLFASWLPLAGLSACGEGAECEQACTTLYAEEACGFAPEGRSDELLASCSNACVAASRIGGELGDYRPDSTDAADFQLPENGAQVDAWQACLAERTCAEIDRGYCYGF